MIIPITKSLSTSPHKLPPQLAKLGNDEIVLIELQGSLEVEGDPDGQLVGTLNIDPKTEKSTILIGHHLLEGKTASLPKPLAVLKKTSLLQKENCDCDSMDENSMDQVGWKVVAVVKRKIIFSKRPMPVAATHRLMSLDRADKT